MDERAIVFVDEHMLCPACFKTDSLRLPMLCRKTLWECQRCNCIVPYAFFPKNPPAPTEGVKS